MRVGDSITIKDKEHPWAGEKGELISFGPYGLKCLNLAGWLIELRGGHRTYAKANQIEGGK